MLSSYRANTSFYSSLASCTWCSFLSLNSWSIFISYRVTMLSWCCMCILSSLKFFCLMKVLLIGAKNSPNFEDDYWRQPATRSVPLCVVGTYNRKLFNGKVLSTWAGKVSFDDLLVHQAASDLKQTIENQNKITFWMSHPRIDPKPTWVENIFLQKKN